MSLMAIGGRTNSVLELGKRLIQPEEEWKDKCEALKELRSLLSDFSLLQNKMKDGPGVEAPVEDIVLLFTPENVQALTQPFRVTLTDLRSTVVKESCATLSLLAQVLGPEPRLRYWRGLGYLFSRSSSSRLAMRHPKDVKKLVTAIG
eukprot:jgi/Phyca11/16760/fgenesh1_pg.PHYCAscaffold_22_\